ncbi:hypothetical protein [Agromyces sp. NBRC 114283]|uniref:adenosine deaminase family protein n=1 Tax=Agromyces sp. NBRC 114283 TaxID=2994521 RepID=UPI0024A1C1AB|nr:hypothetical protein [Agromyces sp. NBRC 114283]GLU89702.1 adenosine deaminase [Agromyces sp. NBRC 114283]
MLNDTMTNLPLTRSIPKIELHAHLIGSVSPATYVELGRRYGAEFESEDPERLYAYHSMPSFLAIYERISSFIRTPEDWSEVIYRSLREEHEASNLRYRETFITPTAGTTLPYADQIAGLADGIDRARADFGVDARLIPSIYRNQGGGVGLELVRTVLEHPHPYVVGIGMDGDENLGPAPDFEAAYRLAREGGLKTTAHAGERNGSREVRHALDVLGVDRIDHGYGIVYDHGLVREAKDRGIHFATTWLSSISHYAPKREENPLSDMLALGLDLSISTDDRSMALSTLMADLETVADAFALSDATLVRQNSAGLEAAWMPEELRDRIREELNDALIDARAQRYDE